ncbi:DUF3658 domain-containing protein [Lysobacter sp. HA35]
MTMQPEADFPPYDPDELAAVKALTAVDVAAIDAAVLQNATASWQKVAMIVISAMYAYPGRYEEIPDHYYGRRVRALAAAGRLEARGNVASMRASEVRLADG